MLKIESNDSIELGVEYELGVSGLTLKVDKIGKTTINFEEINTAHDIRFKMVEVNKILIEDYPVDSLITKVDNILQELEEVICNPVVEDLYEVSMVDKEGILVENEYFSKNELDNMDSYIQEILEFYGGEITEK